MTRRVAFIDATAGIAGDMCLGALVDAGLDIAVIQDVAQRLDLGALTVEARPVQKGAIAATKVDVLYDGRPIGAGDTHAAGGHHGRHLSDVLELLGRLGNLEQPALAAAVRAFRVLAQAEARVHGTTIAQVHFHEVGAADALVDIAGTCIGLSALGVERVFVSPLPWSQGTVTAAHGTMSLPAPATAFLLEGHPTRPSDETFEQVTPTGAALVKALSSGSRTPDGFVLDTIGHGAGDHPGGALPNVVRLVLGRVDAGVLEDDVVVLETNLDDATGQVTAHAVERALAEGALDAWVQAVTMKKGRLGAVLSVLARRDDVGRLEAVLFRETPTLGVRRYDARRTTLTRRHETVETPWGAVRVKVRETPDGPLATPEYEDCKLLADAHGIPLPQVLDAAARAWASDR